MLALFLAASLQLDRVQQSLVGTYRHYQQYVDGVPVLGAEKVEREVNGRTDVVFDTSVAPTMLAAGTGRIAGATQGVAYLVDQGKLRLVRRRFVRTSPLQPYATYIDAETGEEIRREPLFWRATARVFDVNPVVKLNDPLLRDQNDAASAVPEAAYTTVDIIDLDPATPLSGPNVKIVDSERPFTTHADPSQLQFDRSQQQFEEVNAYFHIDRAQKYLQSLGYAGPRRVVNYVIPIDAHAADGADNSFFIQTGAPGFGTLFFGDGGTDDAEDSDLMIHEFGHAIEEWIVPGSFGGGNASESRALGEGFGDYWAFSAKYSAATASGRDPFCIADWDARCGSDDPSQNCAYPPGAECLRRVDSAKTMADFQRSGPSGTEHENGAIWSSMLRDVFLQLVARYGVEQGKRAADTIVIESHFGTPSNPTFAAMTRQMLDADRLLYGAANSDVICNTAKQRGILASCQLLPKGELTFFQSPDQGIAIPDDDPAGIEAQLHIDDTRDALKVFVHVDIAHSARGDLKVSVVAPDGTEVVLHQNSGDRTPDIRGTYGLDLMPDESLDVLNGRPANGTWKLRVADVLPNDTGTLLSWSLVIRFVGDQPSSTRPPSTTGSKFIAAVAHAPGANATMWRSDVRLFNDSQTTAHVTLVFTPSGQDGNAQFGAVKLEIAPEQVVALDDVVAEEFQTVGTGQLEIIGDAVMANARTYTSATHGTYGQFTIATGDPVAVGIVGLLKNNDAFRSNIGFAETSGNAATVRVTLFDALRGTSLRTDEYSVAPFGHFQTLVPMTGDAMSAVFEVVSGSGRVIPYGTVVDNHTGDPIYIPASVSEPGTFVAPVISAPGAFGTHWTSDLFSTNGEFSPVFIDAATGESVLRPVRMQTVFHDIVGELFERPGHFGLLRMDVGDASAAFLSTLTPGDGGSFGQFVPLVPVASSADTIMPIESSYFFRTNIGIANLGDTAARFRVSVRDAAGSTIAVRELTLDPDRLVQFPIQELIGSLPLRSGSAKAERIDTSGPFLFYGSVVDNASGDAVHIPAQ